MLCHSPTYEQLIVVDEQLVTVVGLVAYHWAKEPDQVEEHGVERDSNGTMWWPRLVRGAMACGDVADTV